VLGIALLSSASLLILVQSAVYAPERSALSELVAWMPIWLAQMATLVAVLLATAMVLLGTPRVVGSGPRWGRALMLYLACTFAGFVVVYMLLPGEVGSIYLARMAPLVVYLRDVVVAIALNVLAAILLLVWRRGRELGFAPFRRFALVLPAAGLLVFLGIYWLGIQQAYLRLLPPTQVGFIKLLAQPPFRGASFAVNTYAAPVAAQTDQWAYIDGDIGAAKIDLTESGYVYDRPGIAYMWLADKDSNPAYAKPRYYLCFMQQTLDSVAKELAAPERKPAGCSQRPLVQRTFSGAQSFPRNRIVAADLSGHDTWVILQLDWDYPPYLAVVPGASDGTRVRAEVDDTASRLALRPVYVSHQQDGVPERAALVQLYSGEGRTCIIAQTQGSAGFVFPTEWWGKVRVSVIPRTATAVGPEFFSDPVQVGLPVFILPDTRMGGVQHIRAHTIDEAEQIALAAGSWDPSAGTFGKNSISQPDLCQPGAVVPA
jgi:hypothetical protein